MANVRQLPDFPGEDNVNLEQIGWSAEFGHFRSEVIESEPRKYVATEDPRHSVINPTSAPRFAWVNASMQVREAVVWAAGQ